MNFDQAFDRLIGNEGGYTAGEGDPGGETNWGISQRSYPTLNIRSLTRDEAKAIYYRDFWIAGHMEDYDAALAFQVFDAAVNSGLTRAIKLLQQAAGVAQDGVIGAKTIGAIRAHSVKDMIMLLTAYRLKFWVATHEKQFYGGWMDRAANNLIYATQFP
jgi:lysozyme family protein